MPDDYGPISIEAARELAKTLDGRREVLRRLEEDLQIRCSRLNGMAKAMMILGMDHQAQELRGAIEDMDKVIPIVNAIQSAELDENIKYSDQISKGMLGLAVMQSNPEFAKKLAEEAAK